MAEETIAEVSMKNTKQELIAAYKKLHKQTEEKLKKELNPEKQMQEKKKEEVLLSVETLSTDGVVTSIGKLKLETDKLISTLSDKLKTEVGRLKTIQEAITIKESEIKEIYGIDKSAASLAALIEAQHETREKFALEMTEKKETFTKEVDLKNRQWEKEKKEYEAKTKELTASDEKKYNREREEYEYAFQREKQLAQNKSDDEKARLLAEKEKIVLEMKTLKDQTGKELTEREDAIKEKEKSFQELEDRVEHFPKELEVAINKAIKETGEKVRLEAGYKENLVKKEFEGEKNVFISRIEALEKTVKEQAQQLGKLSSQQELAYQKVQDVAVKAIEGASKTGTFSDLQQILSDKKQLRDTDK